MIKQLLALLLSAPLAFAAVNDIVITQRPSSGTGPSVSRLVTPSVGAIGIGWPASVTSPLPITLGTGLSLTSGGVLSSSASGGTWGTITGTLSAQTDLQNALNAKQSIGSVVLTDAVSDLTSTIEGGGGVITENRTINPPDASGFLALTDQSTGLVNLATGITGFIPAANIASNTISAGKIADAAVTMAKIAQAGATSGQAIAWNGSAWAPATISTGINLGTTTSNGTAGHVLYTDGTNVQAYATTGTGDVVRGTSPTITGLSASSITGTALTLSGGAMTGASSISLSALGTTPTPALSLTNSTAAAAGAQQVSPSWVLEGQGWKTTATAASQSVKFRGYVSPVQGTANPSGMLTFGTDINNSGSWTDRVQIGFGTTSSGIYTTSSSGIFFAGLNNPALTNIGVSGNGLSTLQFHSNGEVTHGVINASSQRLLTSVSGGGFAFSSTTAVTGAPDIILTRRSAGVMALSGASGTTGASVELQEQTAPAAGATNTVRIYAEDNGAGKTRLMAIFPTGAAVQIGIEP